MASSIVTDLTSTVIDLFNHIDFTKTGIYVSAFSTAFNPLVWNIVARREHRTKFMTKAFGGNALVGCYFLSAMIFLFGLLRDYLFKAALPEQPTHPLLLTPYAQALAIATFAWGNVLVIAASLQLGITGTFLGDYFGILKDEIITGFPFNVATAPMYSGSTLAFLGTGLWYGKPAGVLLALWVHIVYTVALRYEDPFTAGIYAERDRKRAAAQSGKKEE